MSGADLVNAANKMYRIVSEEGERTPEQVKEVASLASEALNRVERDDDFRRAVSESSRMWHENYDAAQATLGAYGSQEQLDRFLDQERAVLDTAGLDRGLVDELIGQGQEVVGRAREWRGDQHELLEQVGQLRDRASGLATQLTDAQQIAKTLDKAVSLNAHLANQLEQAYAYNRSAMEELSAARYENQQLAGQLAAAQQTNQDLTNQLANTGPQRVSLPQHVPLWRKPIFWRLTFGVGGLVIVYANTAAIPLIGPPASAASCALGNTLVSTVAAIQYPGG